MWIPFVMKNGSLINWNLFESVREDFPEDFKEVLSRFVQSLEPEMEKMLLAQKQGNTEKMTFGAHRLKGVAGNIGFQCLFELLDTIELEGDRGALIFSQQEYEKVTDLVARSLEEVSRKHPDLTRDIKLAG